MGAPKILIIDDDDNMRRTLSDILTLKGYETIGAGSGEEGLCVLEKACVELVLINLNLPGISGIEVLQKVKELFPSTEAIILTGHASLDTAIEATNKGAFSYLQKPYELEQLLLHIRRAIEKRQSAVTIASLASFPALDPNPVVEADGEGHVLYLNPSAERLFPNLISEGAEHPLLAGMEEFCRGCRSSGKVQTTREVAIGNSVYEQYISYVGEAGRLRIYVYDITERKRAGEALQRQLDEMERLNRLMVGRELKMEEMRKRIRDLEARLGKLAPAGDGDLK